MTVALGPGMTTADGTPPSAPWLPLVVSDHRDTSQFVQFNTYGPTCAWSNRVVTFRLDTGRCGNVSAPISFSLFRLTAEEFADHYAHHYEPYQWGEEREDIPVRGASLDRSWVVDTGPSCPDTECTAKTQIPGRLNSGLYLLQVSALGATDEILLVASSCA